MTPLSSGASAVSEDQLRGHAMYVHVLLYSRGRNAGRELYVACVC